jgi:hypothetical protein
MIFEGLAIGDPILEEQELLATCLYAVQASMLNVADHHW